MQADENYYTIPEGIRKLADNTENRAIAKKKIDGELALNY